MTTSTRVIDYEGSKYRTDFWVDQGREYEDAAERILLRRLIPSTGQRIVEIGAGFGRLADLYTGYEQIVLFDYSRTLLEEAVQTWGHDPRFVFVAGNIYELPFASHVMDTLVMVRVMHHLADVPKALDQLCRVQHVDSTSIIEYANKRNLKSILRRIFGKQTWSPFDLEPYEFVDLNIDFHPTWMRSQFDSSGLAVQKQFAISHFRLPALKQLISADFLARLDNTLSNVGGMYPISPSVFMQSRVQADGKSAQQKRSTNELSSLFCCASCGNESLSMVDDHSVTCNRCSTSYSQKGKIWDFKESSSPAR